MADGVVLRGDLTAAGRRGRNAVPGRFPVVVTITAYNKAVIASGSAASSPAPTRRTWSSAGMPS